jgi:hypothetical protein
VIACVVWSLSSVAFLSDDELFLDNVPKIWCIKNIRNSISEKVYVRAGARVFIPASTAQDNKCMTQE